MGYHLGKHKKEEKRNDEKMGELQKETCERRGKGRERKYKKKRRDGEKMRKKLMKGEKERRREKEGRERVYTMERKGV